MGGSQSRGCGKQVRTSPVRTVYLPDRATQEKLNAQRIEIEALNKKLELAAAEAKKNSDPEHYRQAQKAIFDELLLRLKHIKFVDPLPEQFRGARNVMVIGGVSAGKSSLLNKLYGLQLPAGVGHTTTEIAPVHTDGGLILWDSPGCNQDWAFYDPDTMNFVYAMTLVVILYRDSLLPLDNVVRVVHQIKGSSSMVCVRTQCDLFSVAGHTQALTVDQEMQRDTETLANLGITGVRLFKTATVGANEFECSALKATIAQGIVQTVAKRL